jgi:hypothetical protein
MVRTWRIVVVLVSAAISLVFSPSALSQMRANGEPCEGDCNGQLAACQNTWQPYVSAVFLGRATEVREEAVPITLDGQKKLTEKLIVTFEVEEAFIGISEKVVTVSSGGDMCAFPFLKGKKFLVYSRRLPDGQLYVSICSGTTFADTAADDLKYLRGLPNAPHGATIYGRVFRYTEPEKLETKVRRATPETGKKVEIQGPDKRHEAIVDESGNFSLKGLPPGHYTVLLSANGEISTYPPIRSTTVDVADKGCARFNFWIDPFAQRANPKIPSGMSGPSEKESTLKKTRD